MTTKHTRRVNLPAYYLGRPAAFWLAVMAPRSTRRPHPPTGRHLKHAPAAD